MEEDFPTAEQAWHSVQCQRHLNMIKEKQTLKALIQHASDRLDAACTVGSLSPEMESFLTSKGYDVLRNPGDFRDGPSVTISFAQKQ